MSLLTINTVPLDGLGFGLSSYSGLRRLPTKRLGTVEIPGRNGVIPVLSMNSYEPNEHALSMWVASPEQCEKTARMAGFNSILDMLFHLFGPLDRLLDVQLTMNDTDTRQAFCRVTDTVMPETSEIFTGEFTVLLQVPDAFWQDVDRQIWSGAASASAPHNRTVTTLQGSTAPIEDAVYLVDGPADSGVTLSCPDTGGWVTLNRALDVTEVWRVDAARWRSEVGPVGIGFDGSAPNDVIAQTEFAGSGVRLLTVVPVVDWAGVLEGDETAEESRQVKLTLSGSGFGASTRVQVRARRKFL